MRAKIEGVVLFVLIVVVSTLLYHWLLGYRNNLGVLFNYFCVLFIFGFLLFPLRGLNKKEIVDKKITLLGYFKYLGRDIMLLVKACLYAVTSVSRVILRLALQVFKKNAQ
jgi:hypothetical protein